MLKAAAGEMWGVNPGRLHGAGHIFDPAAGRRAPRTALVEMARKQKPPESVRLQAADKAGIIGRSLKRGDTPAKVDGSAVYGIDVAMG